MYTNIFYFIIVFTVYSLYTPDPAGAAHHAESMLMSFALVSVFAACVYIVFRRFSDDACRRPLADCAARHSRTIMQCNAFAIAVYCILLYRCDLKYAVSQFAPAGKSLFVSQCAGIAPYVLLVLIVWMLSFHSYRLCCDASATRGGYLMSHIRFNGAFVVPWLLFGGITDAVSLLGDMLPGIPADSQTASVLLYGVILGSLGILYPFVLVRIWNCSPVPDGALRRRLETFCSKHNFKYADMLLWDLFQGKLVTAGVLGFVRMFRYLLLSPALVSVLSPEELESVVAHEIGHVKYRHMLFYLLFIAGYALFSYIGFNAVFYGLISSDTLFDVFFRENGTFSTSFYVLPSIVILVFFIAYFRFVFGWFSRNFERQSDAHALILTGSAGAIIRSFDKIAARGTHSRSAPNWHHYSIQERIDFLLQCEKNPALVRLHSRKVVRMIAAYCSVLVLGVCYVVFAHDHIMSGTELNALERVVEKRIAAEPDNHDLYFLLGNVKYEKKMLAEAAAAYTAAIELEPNNAEALNNLAWLYVTADDEAFYRPGRALVLARRAARISRKPHILDTLAECYYKNGSYREAVEVIRMAIEQNPGDPEYYAQQHEKFMQRMQQVEK